jgi:hypothetical protein
VRLRLENRRPRAAARSGPPRIFRWYGPCNPDLAGDTPPEPDHQVSKLLRGIVAGYGARKLTGGCGCLGLIVFIILWMILGNFEIFR